MRRPQEAAGHPRKVYRHTDVFDGRRNRSSLARVYERLAAHDENRPLGFIDAPDCTNDIATRRMQRLYVNDAGVIRYIYTGEKPLRLIVQIGPDRPV